jgi:hypothetical protein
MSSRLTKKSVVSLPGAWVKTPFCDPPALAPSTRKPPGAIMLSAAWAA